MPSTEPKPLHDRASGPARTCTGAVAAIMQGRLRRRGAPEHVAPRNRARAPIGGCARFRGSSPDFGRVGSRLTRAEGSAYVPACLIPADRGKRFTPRRAGPLVLGMDENTSELAYFDYLNAREAALIGATGALQVDNVPTERLRIIAAGGDSIVALAAKVVLHQRGEEWH